jgi:hypothetical protein
MTEESCIEFVAADDFGSLDEETFRELCGQLQFDAYDDSIKSADILEKKRILDQTRTRKRSREAVTTSSGGSSSTSSQDSSNNKKLHLAVPVLTSRKAARSSLPADDLRLRLASIFADGYNTQTKSVLMDILRTYCYDNCLAVYKYIGNENPYGGKYVELQGIEAIGNYWELLFCAIPDSVYDIEETKVRILRNHHSAIVAKFIFTGTKMFSMSSDEYESIVYTDDHTATVSDVQYRDEAVGRSTENIKLTGMMEKSLSVTVLGTATYYVDETKKIYKIEFIYCMRN